MSKRPGSVWNYLWGHALQRSTSIICKSRVLYPSPGFLSSATWPSLPKKHYNGLINQPFKLRGHHKYDTIRTETWPGAPALAPEMAPGSSDSYRIQRVTLTISCLHIKREREASVQVGRKTSNDVVVQEFDWPHFYVYSGHSWKLTTYEKP